MTDHRMYVLVRRADLRSQNPGKAMAQVNHAGTQAAYFLGKDKEYKEWANQACHFGTTIILESGLDEIKSIERNCTDAGIATGVIIDPTYPFKMDNEISQFLDETKRKLLNFNFTELTSDGILYGTRTETTCMWVFVKEHQLEKWTEITGDMKLYP